MSKNGITCDPAKIKEIENWPVPDDKTDIKSFRGLVGYYRKMVPEFTELAVPLNGVQSRRLPSIDLKMPYSASYCLIPFRISRVF